MADSHATPTRPPACPKCAAPATRTTTYNDHGVVNAVHLCAEGHMWRISWTEAA